MKTAVVAAVSGVSVLALGGAIVWLTPSSPTPKAAPVADTTTPTESPSAAPTQRAGHTRTSRPEPQTESTPSTLPTTPRLTLGTLRPGGGQRNGDCWTGEVTLQALVTRTGTPLTVQYTWLVDGIPTTRSSTTIPENGRRLLTTPTPLTTAGIHTITLRITAPVTRQRTLKLTTCDTTLQ